MATVNMKQARKWQSHYNVECQLIPGASETNCKGVMYKGTLIKTSNYTGMDFELLFEKLACGQVSGACSVAKQMINDAHGRTREESLKNYANQGMTYAGCLTNVQFYGRTLMEVLIQVYDKQIDHSELDLCQVKNWMIAMKDMHGSNYLKATNKLIADKDVRIIKNHVVASKFFYQAIDQWIKENNLSDVADDNKTVEILDKFCKVMGD